MNKLAALTFTPEGEINEEAASWVLSNLTRSQLKSYLAALRREMRRHGCTWRSPEARRAR